MRLFFVFLLLSSHANSTAFSYQELSEAAIARTTQNVTYTPAYVRIPYPMGDVPKNTGVCTDVIIRSYRKLGIDLQQLVHEDMKKNFDKYPKLWGLKKTDTNIDHRRVPNLQIFFKRFGKALPITKKPEDYKPGDLVTWNLRERPGSLPHIGIVTTQKTSDQKRPLIAHNIGEGPKLEDILFSFEITGHYRYKGD